MPAEPDDLQAVLAHAQFAGDEDGGPPDPFAVAPGVGVLDVDGLHQRPDGGAVRGVLAVVLGEDPAGDVHRQQDDQRGQRTVRAAPQDRHHQPRQSVHQMRPQRAGQQPAPGPSQGQPFGRHQDGAVQRGQYEAEGQGGGAGGQDRVGQVGEKAGAAERGGAAEQSVDARGGPDREGELCGPPDAPCGEGRLFDPADERSGHRDERGGGGRQQERGSQQQGKERSGTDRHGASEEGAAPGEFTGEIEPGEQCDSDPGGSRAAAQRGEHTEQGAQRDRRNEGARRPACGSHPLGPPPNMVNGGARLASCATGRASMSPISTFG